MRSVWCPEHYDSQFNLYGYLLRDFVLGRIGIDLKSCIETVQRAEQIPDQVFVNAMRGFVVASRAYYQNDWVFLPAANNPKHTSASFQKRFIARIRKSTHELIDFLGELANARQNHDTNIHRFYAVMSERA
jgi:hypothetical protein